jgi:ketosteroid isomerase-like protein
LIAHDEIRMLAHRYALAIDSRHLDALVALFVDDVQVGAHVTGREALKGFFARTLREVGVTVLQVGGHVIDVDEDGEHATGTVYCRGGIQQGEVWVEQAIAYLDTYERRDGHWLFVRRDHHLFFGVEAAERPLAQEPANWPASGTGVGTLPEQWPSWGAFWSAPQEG